MLLAEKKLNFMQGFKSAILAKLKKVQKGDFLKKDLRELFFFLF